MSVRITSEVGPSKTTIRVEGRLRAEDAPALRQEFESARGLVTIDLSGLMSADADGLKVLEELSARGAKTNGASAYIRELLNQTPR